MKSREERLSERARTVPLAPKDTLDLVREGIESGALELIGKQDGYGPVYYVYAGYCQFYACVMSVYGCGPVSVEVISSSDVDLYIDLETPALI